MSERPSETPPTFNTERPLTAQRLAQYVARGRCERYLRFSLFPSEAKALLAALSGSSFEPLSPLLSGEGQVFEREQVARARRSRASVLDLTNRRRRALRRGGPARQPAGRVFYYQPKLEGRIGAWACEGRADLVEVVARPARDGASTPSCRHQGEPRARRSASACRSLSTRGCSRQTLGAAGLGDVRRARGIVARDTDVPRTTRARLSTSRSTTTRSSGWSPRPIPTWRAPSARALRGALSPGRRVRRLPLQRALLRRHAPSAKTSRSSRCSRPTEKRALASRRRHVGARPRVADGVRRRGHERRAAGARPTCGAHRRAVAARRAGCPCSCNARAPPSRARPHGRGEALLARRGLRLAPGRRASIPDLVRVFVDAQRDYLEDQALPARRAAWPGRRASPKSSR